MAKKSAPNLFTEDEWISTDDPMVGEVIRWEEPVWSSSPAKKKSAGTKRTQVGMQQITAEILSMTDTFYLFVEDVTPLPSASGGMSRKSSVEPGTKIVRKLETILEHGNCERLQWLDEGVRAFHADDPKRKR